MDKHKLYPATQNAIYHFAENITTRRLVPITKPRYDVSEKIAEALSGRNA